MKTTKENSKFCFNPHVKERSLNIKSSFQNKIINLNIKKNICKLIKR